MPDKRKRKRKSYTIDQVRMIGSHGLMTLENIILSDSDKDRKIRAINALATLINSYSRLSELHELEERITQLENNQLKRVI